MVSTVTGKDGNGAAVQFPVVDDGTGVLTPVHLEQPAQRTALLAAFSPLATDASLQSIKTALGSPLQTGGAVTISGVSTAANQTTQTSALQALASSSVYALVTPSDSVALAATTRAITIGGAGNLSVKRPDGTTIGPIPVSAGQTLAIAATYVMATNTTATGILAQY